MMTNYDDDLDEIEADLQRPRLSTRARMFIITGIALLTAITSYFAFHFADQDVRWRDVGYSIDSPTEATTTFDVFLYKDKNVTCYVEALNTSFAQVGVSSVEIAYDAGKEQRITVPIATTQRATTAVVHSCK